MAAVCVLALLPASAAAGVRHASPTGADVECSQANPCRLETAVSGAAENDEVVVGPGTHALGATLAPTVALTIHGSAGQARPRIVAPLGGGALESFATVRISDLTLESSDPGITTVALFGDASSAERVEVIATATGAPVTALRPGDGFVLKDSLLRASGGANTDALFYQATSTSVVTVRNVTVVATGTNSNGLSIFATAEAAGARIDATNVIAVAAVDVSATADPAATSAINLFTSHFNTGEGIIGGSGNQPALPLFVNASAGDYHAAAGSPMVDRGLSDPENGPLDLDGNARVAGSTTDIGAYELAPAAAGASTGAPVGDKSAAGTVIGALRLSRSGVVRTTLACPAGESRCAWSYRLRSRKRVRTRGKRRVIAFGAGKATAAGGKRVTVRIRMSERNFRLIKRKRRLTVKLTVRMTDAAANIATSKRAATLEAPKRATRTRRAAL